MLAMRANSVTACRSRAIDNPDDVSRPLSVLRPPQPGRLEVLQRLRRRASPAALQCVRCGRRPHGHALLPVRQAVCGRLGAGCRRCVAARRRARAGRCASNRPLHSHGGRFLAQPAVQVGKRRHCRRRIAPAAAGRRCADGRGLRYRCSTAADHERRTRPAAAPADPARGRTDRSCRPGRLCVPSADHREGTFGACGTGRFQPADCACCAGGPACRADHVRRAGCADHACRVRRASLLDRARIVERLVGRGTGANGTRARLRRTVFVGPDR